MLSKKYQSAFMTVGSLVIASLVHAAPAHSQDLWIINKKDSRPLLVLDQKQQLVSKTIQEKNANYRITIRFPQIEGANLSASSTQFNQLVKSLVDGKVNGFKSDLDKSAANTSLPKMQSYLDMNYESTGFVSHSQNTEYTSDRFEINSFERGMAHPSQETTVINYDLGNNKSLSLDDLFQANSNYLAAISNYCIKQLSAKHFPNAMIEEGAAPKMENYKNWNMTLKGLLITFSESQVAPRYNGAQTVLIPYEALKANLSHQAACTLGVINCDVT